MRLLSTYALVAFVASALIAERASANLVVNPSFEDPITSDGPPFVGSWEGFSGGGASAINGTIMPRTGVLNLALAINNTDNTFAGAFQDIPNVVPGSNATFSLWHKTPSNPLDLVSEVRIEWRDSVSNTEVSRTPNSTPVATSDYTKFSMTLPVPAGVDTARLVYAIQTFTGGPTNNGVVFVDDVSFIVPEPASAALLSLACFGLVAIRRR